jgi:hypothetical protein
VAARAARPTWAEVEDPSPLERARAEYRRLIGSMEFAYAMGHSRTIGDDPRLQRVLDRADELRRHIAALEAEGG